ncbi:MAG: alpha/beta hydrolase [Immundisolibacter sp.]|uniref:alpha/beta hydrolase n=1 Tax=Immundisolibacter sp. TaxID=1934948 RepID=UPI003EE080B6
MGVLVNLCRLLPVALLFGLAGCAPLLTTLTPGPAAVTRGVAFDPDTGLKLDVYAPPQAKDAPVVVFFYGGRWQDGTRRHYGFIGKALASRGVVVMVPDYRVYPTVRFPAFLDDCARAVVWAHEHAAQFGGDAGKLVLMGHSAGAYNAAMLALDADLLAKAGGSRQWLRGMIGFGGPYDFLPITDPILRQVFGPAEQWPGTQPVNFASASAPPLLLLHGADDTTVRPRNSESLAAQVNAQGGTATSVLFPDLGHVWPLVALAGPLRWRANALDQVDAFVRQVTAASEHGG